MFNCLLINCRSLKTKLNSLVTNFLTNKTTVALLNETWFQKRDTQLKCLLERVAQESNISIIRRDRNSRGGGVAIALHTEKMELKKVVPVSMRGKTFEILVAAGKLIGYKEKHVVLSSYLPPNYTRQENNEIITTRYVWSVQPKMYIIFSAPRHPYLLVARCVW